MSNINQYYEDYDIDNLPVEAIATNYSFFGKSTGVMTMSFSIILENGEEHSKFLDFRPDGRAYEVALEMIKLLDRVIKENYDKVILSRKH